MHIDGIKPLEATIALIAIGLVFLAGRWSMTDTIDRRDRDLGYYRQTYQHRNGASLGFGSYHLVSIDAGQTWHSWDRDSGTITPADPSLLSHLDGVEALLEHVHQHGSIGSKPITDDDIRALQGAGFEVRDYR